METTKKRSTVYITQEMRGRDLSDATTFGDLEILLPAGDQAAYSTAPTVRKMNRKLVNFTDDDYLLLSGDPVAIGIAAALAAKHNRGRFRVLKWDRQECCYYPLQVNLNPGASDANDDLHV